MYAFLGVCVCVFVSVQFSSKQKIEKRKNLSFHIVYMKVFCVNSAQYAIRLCTQHQLNNEWNGKQNEWVFVFGWYCCVHYMKTKNYSTEQNIFRLSICSSLFAYVTTKHEHAMHKTTINGDQLSTNCPKN